MSTDLVNNLLFSMNQNERLRQGSERVIDALTGILEDSDQNDQYIHLRRTDLARWIGWLAADFSADVLEGVKCSGSTSVSKTDRAGSIPAASAITTEQLDQLQFGRSLHERPK